MATIVTRSGKGSPLTNTEVDNNFTNLNTDKQEILTEGAFVDGDKTKLDGIEAGADVTDTANVTAAGALMDSEVTNLAQVKAFDSSDYATAAQGALADSALQNITGESIEDLSDVNTMTPSDGQLLTWDNANSRWDAADAPVSLPDQTGYSGYFLTTDGSTASWAVVATDKSTDGGFANSTYLISQSVDGGSASG